MKKRFFFNLIEILLAISIISIGLSSVMVLFTSGLRAGNAAAVSSNQPNISESLLSHVRRCVMIYSSETDASSGWKTGTGSSGYDDFPTASLSGDSTVTWGDFDTSSNLPVVRAKTKKGVFLYREMALVGGVPVTFFSAIAETRWITAPDDIEFDGLPLALKTSKNTDGKVDTRDAGGSSYAWDKCRRVFELRISYPAEAAPADREYRHYRMAVYNDKYDRFICEEASEKPE